MSEIDLNALTLPQLKSLQARIERTIADFDQRRKREARTALEARAKELGFALDELLDVAKTGKKGRKAPSAARYAHPDNPELTWTGRGRRPGWFTAAMDAGKSPEDLAVA